jgi:aspartyl-tRNA(Asn)/glutamyl-tRNA(Gln) amidotransferase subunit C
MTDNNKAVAQQMDVRYVANLARLHLTDTEAKEFQAQLGRIVEYFNELSEVDLGDSEPMAHATVIQNVFREDVCRPSLDSALVMKNAPQQGADLFIVPKIVE